KLDIRRFRSAMAPCGKPSIISTMSRGQRLLLPGRAGSGTSDSDSRRRAGLGGGSLVTCISLIISYPTSLGMLEGGCECCLLDTNTLIDIIYFSFPFNLDSSVRVWSLEAAFSVWSRAPSGPEKSRNGFRVANPIQPSGGAAALYSVLEGHPT